MGITGLLPFLEKASRPVNISEFSGCTVAVDSYCWLHKGAFSCAEKLARGEHTDQYVSYCMKLVNMLLSHNIKPIMVFDGRHLPAKAETEKKRRESRELNRKKAAEFLRLERTSEARTFIQRCVDVTHEMALKLIKRCRGQGVDCIVAPYEADAQLAFLNINGFAHIIITEDSDLMLFGCKMVLFKMDNHGNGILVEQSKIPLAMKMHPRVFSMDKFRYMCILSGCDYLKSLPGIGLGKAAKFIKKTQDDNISRALTRLGAYLCMPNLVVTQDYCDKFVEADGMFMYQPVFDPKSRRMVTLNPLPPGEKSVLVDLLPPDTAYQLALGNLNPFNLKPLDSWDPDQPQNWKNPKCKDKSIWSKNYQLPGPLLSKRNLRDVKHASTKGKVVTQSVTVLTDKISTLPKKQDFNTELANLRESYGIASPPSKKLCIDMFEENESERQDKGSGMFSCDSGIATDGSESERQSSQETTGSELGDIMRTPSQHENKDLEVTVDDLLNDDIPLPTIGMSRNPFSSQFQSKTSQSESTRKSLGALDVFSKLKKTQVEAACIVQSRFFAPGGTPETSQKKAQGNKDTDLNESLFEIINSTPSPKRKSSLLQKRKISLSPRKNLFQVIDMEENTNKQEEVPSPKCESPATPRENIFSVTGFSDAHAENESSPSKNPFAVTKSSKLESSKLTPSPRKSIFLETKSSPGSPKQKSFLKILHEVSEEIIQPDCTTKEEVKPVKNKAGPSFRLSQPQLGSHSSSKHENSLIGLYKPTSKQRLPVFSSKSPKGGTKKSASTSQSGKQPLPQNATFKQKPATASGQKSLLNMFAFQPKPKLLS